MELSELGEGYKDGEYIVHQGEVGDCMYVIQEGRVEVIVEEGGREIRLGEYGAGNFFSEMALFDRDVRSASVRALGNVRILTIDKKNFMRQIHEYPTLAFRIVETMSRRIRELNDELTRLKSGG